MAPGLAVCYGFVLDRFEGGFPMETLSTLEDRIWNFLRLSRAYLCSTAACSDRSDRVIFLPAGRGEGIDDRNASSDEKQQGMRFFQDPSG